MVYKKEKLHKKPIVSPYKLKDLNIKNKMKLVEIINSVESLNQLVSAKLPAKTSYKIGRLSQKLAPEVEAYFKLKNNKMVEYGTVKMKEDGTTPATDEKGNEMYTFDKENGEKFINELREAEEVEVTVEIPEIKIEDLGDISIEPKYLSVLSWLIKE